MVIARTVRENIRYVAEKERDLPAEQQTVFLLASLPNHILLALLEMIAANQTKKWVEVALTAGLRGWERFADDQGNEAPFRRDVNVTRSIHGVEVKGPVSKSTIELLPTDLLIELANAIVSQNQLTNDDAKN